MQNCHSHFHINQHLDPALDSHPENLHYLHIDPLLHPLLDQDDNIFCSLRTISAGDKFVCKFYLRNNISTIPEKTFLKTVRETMQSAHSTINTTFGISELLLVDWNVTDDSDIITIKSSLNRDIMFGYIWWMFITIISLYNIYTLMNHWRKWFLSPSGAFQMKMLYLSTIYVFVCAVRAIWPRKDVDRICFFDHQISTVFIGRSIATIAELCFVKQLSLVLKCTVFRYNSNINGNNLWFMNGYKYYVSFILIAEIFSWTGVATKCQIWNAFEESIWMITALHMTISYILLYRARIKRSGKDKKVFLSFIVCGIGYVIFMCFIDIPMYAERYYIDTYVNNVNYLSFNEGVVDLMQCKQIIHDFSVWWEDIPWMTAYFSVGVWISMYFINISLISNQNKKK